MDKRKLDKFKEKLLQAKTKILNGEIMNSREDLTVMTEDLSDEADLANSIINQQVTFNIRNREIQKLRMIDEALWRMKEGSFGHCEDCDEEIEEKRLLNQPWTTLCISHAEEREREEAHTLRFG